MSQPCSKSGQLSSKHSHRLQGNQNGLHGGGGKALAEMNGTWADKTDGRSHSRTAVWATDHGTGGGRELMCAGAGYKSLPEHRDSESLSLFQEQ